MPSTPEAWLTEIAGAFIDAAEAIPCGPLVGVEFGADDLFHLGPAVCLKFRGIEPTKPNLKRATDAALTSYVAMQSRDPGALGTPLAAFAFCYLAAHFGLGFMTEEQVGVVMDYVVAHEKPLARLIEQRRSP